MSAVTSLYLLSCFLQVVDKKEMSDSVASLILYPHVASGSVFATEEYGADSSQVKPSSEYVNKIEQILYSSLGSEDNREVFGCVIEMEPKLSTNHLEFQRNIVQER